MVNSRKGVCASIARGWCVQLNTNRERSKKGNSNFVAFPAKQEADASSIRVLHLWWPGYLGTSEVMDSFITSVPVALYFQYLDACPGNSVS